MYNVLVKEIPVLQHPLDRPKLKWLSAEGEEVIKKFNGSGNKLTLSFYSMPSDRYELECMLEEGMYDFIYPECPEAEDLKTLVEQAENIARFLSFSVEDLLI